MTYEHELVSRLQSLLDRMANDERTGAMFEADGDTLRDAMAYIQKPKQRQPLTEHEMRRVLEAHQKRSYEVHGIDTTAMQLMDDGLFCELLGYGRALEAAHGIVGEQK